VALLLRIALSLAGISELSISVLTPCRVDALCVGGLLATVGRREGGPGFLVQRSGRAALVLAVALLGVSAWCAATKIGLPVLHPIRGTLYAMFFGALTLMSVQNARQSLVACVFQSGSLRTFGKYSYGLYVYHGLLSWQMVQLGTQQRLEALLGNSSLALVANAALGVGVSLSIAALSYELFERRFLALKRLFEATPAVPAPSRPPESRAGEARTTC